MIGVEMLGRRRRRGDSATAVPTPADIAQLQTDMGLTAFGLWDVRGGTTATGLTVVGGGVSRWEDVRGTATYPNNSLTAAGSLRPSWDGTSVNTDGVDDALATAALAALDLSAQNYTVTAALAVSLGTAGNYIVVIRNAAGLKWLGCRIAGAGGTYQGRSSDGTSTLNFAGTALVDGNWRSLILGNRNATREWQIQIPNAALGTTLPAGAYSAEAHQFVVGAFSDAGATPVPAKIRALGIWPAYLSAAQIAVWHAWAQTNHLVTSA